MLSRSTANVSGSESDTLALLREPVSFVKAQNSSRIITRIIVTKVTIVRFNVRIGTTNEQMRSRSTPIRLDSSNNQKQTAPGYSKLFT